MTDKGAKVHCEFLFKNEGRGCTVKMGFPENAWASGEGGIGSLSGFRSLGTWEQISNTPKSTEFSSSSMIAIYSG
ncbi:MAG: hypothetical protein Q7N50_02300 [Armatimonadota bacterium]|nr:hypothetical protein [Armatimonadota bacterium]